MIKPQLTAPTLPFRPVNGKVTPARQPPPKAPPERPPPPRLSATRTSNKKLPFNRSSSDMDLQKKQNNLVSRLSKAKSQVFKSQDPVLPPRPKPGHPLYRKYMVNFAFKDVCGQEIRPKVMYKIQYSLKEDDEANVDLTLDPKSALNK